MSEPKLKVPAELQNMAEKTIEQAERAFSMFFHAANNSMASTTHPAAEISKKALSLTEQNMKAAFDHARKLVHANDLQEAMQIQSEFLKSQFTNAGEQMKQIAKGVMSTAKEASPTETAPGEGNAVPLTQTGTTPVSKSSLSSADFSTMEKKSSLTTDISAVKVAIIGDSGKAKKTSKKNPEKKVKKKPPSGH
jgi:phasin